MVAIEVCVDSVESALEAERGGADRVEICSSLIEGGVTPSDGLIREIASVLKNCKTYVLIRPRPGDFLYTADELRVIRRDLVHAVDCGAQGIVLGILNSAGDVDVDRVRLVTDMCSALGVDFTFHRAFDVARDQRQALEDLIACNVPRVLTSGGQPSALQGLEQIRALVEQANGRIVVMPGGGITEDNAATVARCAGATEIHGTFRVGVRSGMQYVHQPALFALAGNGSGGGCDEDGGGAWGRFCADGDAVARTKQRLAEMDGAQPGEMGGS